MERNPQKTVRARQAIPLPSPCPEAKEDDLQQRFRQTLRFNSKPNSGLWATPQGIKVKADVFEETPASASVQNKSVGLASTQFLVFKRF